MTAIGAEPLLEASAIAKTYGAVVALKSASLAVRPGEVHALMGANGAGKSTLVKILTGAVRPDSGTISVRGKPHVGALACRRPPRRRRLGLPGTGPDPRPRHPVEPAAHRDTTRQVPSLAGRAGHRAAGPRTPGPRGAARHAARHRPRARARDRARRVDARRDDRGTARQPHRAGPRGDRPPAWR